MRTILDFYKEIFLLSFLKKKISKNRREGLYQSLICEKIAYGLFCYVFIMPPPIQTNSYFLDF